VVENGVQYLSCIVVFIMATQVTTQKGFEDGAMYVPISTHMSGQAAQVVLCSGSH
jgi:hypothetical protein